MTSSAREARGEVAPSLAAPRPVLSFRDVVALVVGIVVGAGIFRTPSLVAANSGSGEGMLLLWLLGGVISLVGVLCYGELTTAYPHPGGDYHYFLRAYGRPVGFLFAWSRLTVIQTGSIALLAFVFGDYAAQLSKGLPLSNAVYAALAVVLLTAVNVAGVRQGKWTQNSLTVVEVGGLLLLVVAGLVLVDPTPEGGAAPVSTERSLGLAMIFVLLTYGGWNEAAFVSAEVRQPERNMWRALLASIAVITLLYLLANWAYLRGLGLAGMASSDTVAADLMRRALGERGGQLLSLLVAVSALTSANASILTGARTNFALGRDFALFAPLGRWGARGSTPAIALLVQGALALALVLAGALTRRGFETMVEYTAPVFWLFLLLTGISLLVLRVRDPETPRPFRVPVYPVTPLLFCATSGYLLYSSLAYTGVGAAIGVAVLATGAMVWFVAGSRPTRAHGSPARTVASSGDPTSS